MADIDTNVSNYSLSELLTIVGIDDENINEEQIMKNTNALNKPLIIKKFG